MRHYKKVRTTMSQGCWALMIVLTGSLRGMRGRKGGCLPTCWVRFIKPWLRLLRERSSSVGAATVAVAPLVQYVEVEPPPPPPPLPPPSLPITTTIAITVFCFIGLRMNRIVRHN
ncbi:hypothetical protein QJS04_geneDACA017120 [Acorus gramineus]|uniref:Secreted peptide n=1 Tax=Acorus gramineus TaxID=55184 RepID=A0AAV9AY52_ACOGR|nr:hypothetical protein QJS04_geneDACA017120 [Acorus gramineus]